MSPQLARLRRWGAPAGLMAVWAAAIAWALLGGDSPSAAFILGDPSLDTSLYSAPPDSRAHAPPLDVAAFQLPVWLLPPPAADPEPLASAPSPQPPPPPPPLRMQLLAIVREPEGGADPAITLRAVFFDPDTDRVISVREGEALGSRQAAAATTTHTGRWVERIGPDRVVLALGEEPVQQRTEVLLRPERGEVRP